LGEDEAAKIALAANLGYLDNDPARLWFRAQSTAKRPRA